MANVALRKAEKLPPYQGRPLDPPPSRTWLAPSKSYRGQRRTAYAPHGIDTFVVHATAGGTSSGAMSVTQQGTASWHWLVPDENEDAHGEHVWRCVPDSGAAWHVLSSVKHPADGLKNINDRSLGVEIVNVQDGRDTYSDWQVYVTAELVRYAMSRYPIRYLYTHAYLDPGRKSDPGAQFPWDRFMAYVLGGASNTTAVNASQPKIILLPGSQIIDCHAELQGGVTRCDLRALAEGLGYKVIPDHLQTQGKLYLRAPEVGK